MTEAELRAAAEQVLGEVDFEPPPTVAYCVQVRDRLVALLPGASVDVMHRYREVQVDLRSGAGRVVIVLPT